MITRVFVYVELVACTGHYVSFYAKSEFVSYVLKLAVLSIREQEITL